MNTSQGVINGRINTLRTESTFKLGGGHTRHSFHPHHGYGVDRVSEEVILRVPPAGRRGNVHVGVAVCGCVLRRIVLTDAVTGPHLVDAVPAISEHRASNAHAHDRVRGS